MKKLPPETLSRILRYGLMAALLLCLAGGLALYFLVYLGARAFEIETIYTPLGAALAYPAFCLVVYLSHYVLPEEHALIKVFALSKSEETLQFLIEIGGVLLGTIIFLASGQDADHLKIGLFSWMLFYVPGLTARFIVIMKKAFSSTKSLILLSLIYLVTVLAPAVVMVFFYLDGRNGLGILGMLYIFPLLVYLCFGHKEDNIDEEETPTQSAAE